MNDTDLDRERTPREIVRITGIGEHTLRDAIRTEACRSVAAREGSTHRRTTLRWVREWREGVAGEQRQPQRTTRKTTTPGVPWSEIKRRAYA